MTNVVHQHGIDYVCHVPDDAQLVSLDAALLILSAEHQPRVLYYRTYDIAELPICFANLPLYPIKEGRA